MDTLQVTECPDVASGVWRFKDTIGIATLTKVVIEWMKAEPEKYFDIHFGFCARGQVGIFFKYRRGATDHFKFVHEMSDQLLRQFGNDFVGWDISAATWLLTCKEVEHV